MTTRDEMERYGAKIDAQTLDDAIRIIKRRKVTIPGASRSQVCRTLSAEADELRRVAALTEPKDRQRRKLCNLPKHYLGIPCPNEPGCSWGD